MRSIERSLVGAGVLALTILCILGLPIDIQLDNQQGSQPIFRVVGWGQIGQISTRAAGFGTEQWQALFSVYVDSSSSTETLPPILGSYRIEESTLIFQPRFPLQPGLSYRAVFHPDASASAITSRFDIPEPEAVALTFVEHVYPSTDRLPENQLKFYLHFSAPMSRGEAYSRIHLLDEQGDPVELPFLELDEELWDREGRRLTLLFDPGRIKRDLLPHQEAGVPIREGHSYTLVIDRDWRDAQGRTLREDFRKPFRVVTADREIPDPSSWQITAPEAGSLQPLSVEFSEPMDHGLLLRLLEVLDPEGDLLGGTVQVDRNETRWRLIPQESWKEGDYSLSVATTLEDLAGNRMDRLFEVDVFERVEERVTTEKVLLRFRVLPSGR